MGRLPVLGNTSSTSELSCGRYARLRSGGGSTLEEDTFRALWSDIGYRASVADTWFPNGAWLKFHSHDPTMRWSAETACRYCRRKRIVASFRHSQLSLLTPIFPLFLKGVATYHGMARLYNGI